MDLSFDFDRNFRDLWHNENTSGLHVLVHCGKASEVVEIFPLFLYFFQLGRYYRKDIFPILLFGSCSCKRVKRKCRDSVTFALSLILGPRNVHIESPVSLLRPEVNKENVLCHPAFVIRDINICRNSYSQVRLKSRKSYHCCKCFRIQISFKIHHNTFGHLCRS